MNELGDNPQGDVSFEGQNVNAQQLKDFILSRLETFSSPTIFNFHQPTTMSLDQIKEDKFKNGTQTGNAENEMKFNFNGKKANYSTILDMLGNNPEGDVTFEGEKISAKELKEFIKERIQRMTTINNHLGASSTAIPFRTTSMINEKTLGKAIETTLSNFLQQHSTLIPTKSEDMKFEFNGEEANYSRILQLLGDNPQGNVSFEGKTVNAKELKEFIVESLNRTTLEPIRTEKKKFFQTTSIPIEETWIVEDKEKILEFDFNGKKLNYSTILDALGTNPEGKVVFEGEIVDAKELKDFIQKRIHPKLKTSTTPSAITFPHGKFGVSEKAGAFIVINLDSDKDESIYLPAFPQTYTTTLGNVSISIEVTNVDKGVGVTEIPKENGTALVLTHGKESFMFPPPREEDTTTPANLIGSLKNPFIKKNHTTANHINIHIGKNHSIALLVEPQTYQIIYGNFSIKVVIASLAQENVSTSKYYGIRTEEISTQYGGISSTSTIMKTTSVFESQDSINKLNQSVDLSDLGPPKSFQTYSPMHIPGGSEISEMTLITHHRTDINVGLSLSASTNIRPTTPLAFTSGGFSITLSFKYFSLLNIYI